MLTNRPIKIQAMTYKSKIAFVVVLIACSALLGVAATSRENYPQWWVDREAVVDVSSTNNFAAANSGQLKWFATQAAAELNARLPDGAGSDINTLVAGFQNQNNYVAINLGQLKNVAKPFYDRLIPLGIVSGYPWTTETSDDQNYAIANLGQLKNVFSFDFDGAVDTDGDGLPDWWEDLYGGDRVLFADDFDDGVANGWVEEGGTWTEAGGMYFQIFPMGADYSLPTVMKSSADFDVAGGEWTVSISASMTVFADEPASWTKEYDVQTQEYEAGNYTYIVENYIVPGPNGPGAWGFRESRGVWRYHKLYYKSKLIAEYPEPGTYVTYARYAVIEDQVSIIHEGTSLSVELNGSEIINLPNVSTIEQEGWIEGVALGGTKGMANYFGDVMATSKGNSKTVADSGLDMDGDGLSGLSEFQLSLDPLSIDTDGDGMPDGWEVRNGLNALLDDSSLDPDGDGLSNAEELIHQADPHNADTDGDGTEDGDEVEKGMDPLVMDFLVSCDDLPEDVPVSDSKRFTIPKDTAAIVVTAVVFSEEYPYYTGDQSEFNDEVGYEITSPVATVDAQAYNVNSLHSDFVEGEGYYGGIYTSYCGTLDYSALTAEGDSWLDVSGDAMNIGDNQLPSGVRVTVALIPTIKVDFIEASSTVADNSPQQFEGHKTDFGDPCSRGSSTGQALIVFFDEVKSVDPATTNEVVNDFNVDLHAEILPPTVSDSDLNESWAKVDGPASGSLDKTDTFDVAFKNPKKGGLYKFEFDLGVSGCAKSGANVLLPLAGAESSAFVQSEYARITTWVDNQLPGIPIVDRLFAILILRRAMAVSANLDYSPGDWAGGNSPCKRYSLPVAETLTVEGVVMSSPKLANMMWGVMCSRFMYWDWFANLGAEIRNRIDHGILSGDSDAAKQSYELGRDLSEKGIGSLHNKMREYRDSIREPNAIEFKLFPSEDTLTGPPTTPTLP